MDFLLDVHLPVSLSKFLSKQPNCNCIHVNQILQKWNTPDDLICQYADDNDLVVISKDSDFMNSHLINKTPKKLIRVALGKISNNELLSTFEMHLKAITSLTPKAEFYVEISADNIIVID